MVKKQILTKEQQTQRQILKEQRFLKSENYKNKKLVSLSQKINKCHLPTIKLIYDYLIKARIDFYNEDNEENDDNIIKFDMQQLNNTHIKDINTIIKNNKHINIKTKSEKKPEKNYNYELILFDDE
jgi:hypothetical protein